MASTRGRSCLTSGVLAPVRVFPRGMPVASVSRWCLLPGLARSVGLGPVLPPAPTARTEALSTTAWDQSILPAPCGCPQACARGSGTAVVWAEGEEVRSPPTIRRREEAWPWLFLLLARYI